MTKQKNHNSHIPTQTTGYNLDTAFHAIGNTDRMTTGGPPIQTATGRGTLTPSILLTTILVIFIYISIPTDDLSRPIIHRGENGRRHISLTAHMLVSLMTTYVAKIPCVKRTLIRQNDSSYEYEPIAYVLRKGCLGM